MPVYNVFEVFPDGTYHDTDKTVFIPGRDYAKLEVFRLFGFKSAYDNYFRATSHGDEEIRISTTLPGIYGDVNIWVLKLDDEVKEKDNGD